MQFEFDIERLRHRPETPLRALRRSFWWVRKTFFSKPKPENPAVVVPMDEPVLRTGLGDVVQLRGRAILFSAGLSLYQKSI